VWSQDRRRVDLTVPIAAGRRYAVRSFDVTEEQESLSIPDFGREFRMLGEPYHVRLPAEFAARLRGWLANHGHRDAQVDVAVNVNDDTGDVDLHFRLRPGPIRRLHAVIVQRQPNARTDARFIRGRFPDARGQAWNQRDIDAGVGDLY